ncbi:hypothetical protein, partial [Bacillus cereus]|uniref:hypothetical protein n=1 Tax=Bacillus cereus TaxID=1396 RepID=UPI00345C12C3
ETPGVTVHVLPVDGEAPRREHAARPRGSWGSPTGDAVTLAGGALVTLLASALFHVLNLGNVALLYLLPVM